MLKTGISREIFGRSSQAADSPRCCSSCSGIGSCSVIQFLYRSSGSSAFCAGISAGSGLRNTRRALRFVRANSRATRSATVRFGFGSLRMSKQRPFLRHAAFATFIKFFRSAIFVYALSSCVWVCSRAAARPSITNCAFRRSSREAASCGSRSLITRC